MVIILPSYISAARNARFDGRSISVLLCIEHVWLKGVHRFITTEVFDVIFEFL